MNKKRRFRIDAGRYGGEMSIGKVTKEFVEYFIEKEEDDLIDTIQSYEWDDDDMGDKNAPKIDGFTAWNECDDKEHIYGMYVDAGFFLNEVPIDGSDDMNYSDNEIEVKGFHLYDREAYYTDKSQEKIKINEKDDYEPVLGFLSAEKGGLGCWFVETDENGFDPKKLAFSTVASNLANIVENVWYDKIELEANFDHSDTTGKGYYASVGYFNNKWHDKKDTSIDFDWDAYDEQFES